ncbi:hypothetical protein [Bernardetia sp.]|uniref:hypothetical protein n=1 Tax=Bernardetia sp. TaxID=1937974 RepID=UPI0025C630FC|nr:hypothetical protein [Bernardetia sp.]
MLDFYFIQNDQTKPNYPKDVEFAGSLDFDIFERLQRKGVISNHYNYYSDFYWSREVIAQIIEKTKDSKDTDKELLLQIIEKAYSKKQALVAYCD